MGQGCAWKRPWVPRAQDSMVDIDTFEEADYGDRPASPRGDPQPPAQSGAARFPRDDPQQPHEMCLLPQ